MSKEPNPRRNAINKACRDKAKGQQTRRARGGKKQREGKNAVSRRQSNESIG